MDFTRAAVVLLTLLHAAVGLALLQETRISAGHTRQPQRGGERLRRWARRLRLR